MKFEIGEKVYLPSKGYAIAFGTIAGALPHGSYKVKFGNSVKEYYAFELQRQTLQHRDENA